MTKILILEANSPELNAQGHHGAAGFVATLQAIAPKVGHRVHSPYARPVVADDLEGIDGVIFTGSGVAWSVDAPEGAVQRDAMDLVMQSGLPIWGSCNGMQLAACVLGGGIGVSPNGLEVGLARDLQLTEAGQRHAAFAGRQSGFAVPCVHRDEVQRLPDGAVLLVGNAHTPIQGFAYEQGGVDFWGVQYHPELRSTNIAAYLRIRDGIFADKKHMIDDLDAAESDAGAAARVGSSPDALAPAVRATELANWLKHVEDRT